MGAGITELGDLLTLLHEADARSDRLRVEYREWTRPAPSNVLIVHRSDPPLARWRNAGPFPRAVTIQRRIWAERPNRIRVEVHRDGACVRVGVRDGEQWRRWDSIHGEDHGSVTASDGFAAVPPLLRSALLAPALLIGSLRFQAAGAGILLGRQVVLAQAGPRFSSELSGRWRHDFAFDVETGVVLRRASAVNDQQVQLTEATRMIADGPLPRHLFADPQPSNRC
jgi:hypothetical protein